MTNLMPALANSPAASAPAESAALSELEIEVIDLFIGTARVLALPRSVAEIYGLLYISPEPLTLDALVNRLKMSKGSASQGLRFLRGIGAISMVYVPGSRCDHFAAVVEIRKLISGFFKGAVQQQVERGALRLERIRNFPVNSGENSEFYQSRIVKLGQWYQRAHRLLPLALTIFGKNT